MGAIRKLVVCHRDFRLLLTAGLISLTGDWILRVGLMYEVYSLTGSTIASGALLAASLVPQLALGSLAGVFVDRWERRSTMVAVNVLLAASLLPLLAVHSASDVWIVYPVSFAAAVLVQFLTPAEAAVAPLLVPEARLGTANALVGQSRDAARLLGSALGGVLGGAGGIGLVGGIDLASFLLAAVLVALIATPSAALRDQPAVITGRLEMLRAEWVDGMRIARNSPALRIVLGFLAVTSIGEGVMGALFAPFVRRRLDGSATDFGTIVSAQAAGGIVGGLVVASIAGRLSPWGCLAWGSAAFGLIDLTIFLYPLLYVRVWPAVVLMVLVGLPSALLLTGLMTIFQTATTDAYRGRIYGVMGTVTGAASLLGIVAASTLATRIGIVPVLAVDAACYIGSGILVLVVQRPGGPTRRVGAGGRGEEAARSALSPSEAQASSSASARTVTSVSRSIASIASIGSDGSERERQAHLTRRRQLVVGRRPVAGAQRPERTNASGQCVESSSGSITIAVGGDVPTAPASTRTDGGDVERAGEGLLHRPRVRASPCRSSAPPCRGRSGSVPLPP